MSEVKPSPSTGKSAKRKFSQGDKVFAKVRGYPSWPARIEAIADEHPSRMKYHVYFYGTGETAVVKGEDVCSFFENKNRLGKPKKLSEAMKQAEADLTDHERSLLQQFVGKGGSDMEDSFNVSGAAGGNKQRRSSALQSSPGVTTPRTSTTLMNRTWPANQSSAGASPAQAKRKRQDSTKESAPVDEAVKSTGDSDHSDAPPVSRTGRVIKQTKKSTEAEGVSLIESIPPARHSEPPGPASKKIRAAEQSWNNSNDRGDDYIWAEKDKARVKIPLKLNAQQFKDPTMAKKWDDEALEQALLLKKELKDGKIKLEDIASKMHAWMTKRMRDFEEQKVKRFEIEHDILQIDYQIKGNPHHLKKSDTLSIYLEIDCQVKGALALKKADTERCIEYLDKLSSLKVTPLMLKKHPEVVHTVKKIRNYVGNTGAWNMTNEEKEQFDSDAEVIRGKAEKIYNKFRSLFLTSENRQSFWGYFSDEITKFEEKTKELSSDEVFSLVYEP